MNDAELIALAALVSFEASLYSSINQERLHNGYSIAYDDTSLNFDLLRKELVSRGVLHD